MQSYIFLSSQPKELSGEYIAGFVEGEGCFSIGYSKRKNGTTQLYPNFTIQLHVIDLPLLELIQKTLQCGRIYHSKKRNIVNFKVYRRSDLINKIIPFFDKYQFYGNKLISFEYFKEAMKLFSMGEHKTIRGKKRIIYLKERMNTREDR